MPVPDATTEATAGAVVSICSVPAGLVTAPERLAALPAPSLTVAPFEVDRRHRQVGGVLAGANRVAEGQRIGAGAAGIGRGAAVVERQRRRAARNRHRLAQVDRQRDDVAGVRDRRAAAVMPVPDATTEATVGAVVSICSVPAGLVTAPVRLAALPAPSLTVAALRLTAVTARSAVFWPAADRVAEGQRIGAGAAGIGRGAAVVERQRRRAAGNRHRLAQVDRQRHDVAGSEIAGAGRDAGAGRHHRGHRRRRGVDLQRAGRVGHRAGEEHIQLTSAVIRDPAPALSAISLFPD